MIGRLRLIVGNETTGLISDAGQLAVELLSHVILEVAACGLELGGPAFLGPSDPSTRLGHEVRGFGAGRLEQLIQPGFGLDKALEILDWGMILGVRSRFVHMHLVSRRA